MNMKYAMRSEDTEQINVVSWANWNVNRYPELRWLFHVPNGGSRNKQEAVKFKQMEDNHCSGRPCDKSRGGRCDKKRELAVATV